MRLSPKTRGRWTSGLIFCLLLFLSILSAPGLSAGAATRAATIAGSPSDPIALPHLPSTAHGRAVIENDAAQVEARLLISPETPRRIGVLFDLAPGWHLYWRNPGETGIAPELEIEAEGYRVGTLAWPAPQVFREADGLFTTYGYEERVLLFAPLEPDTAPSATASGNSGMARVEATVLVCNTQCVPAEFSLRTPIDVAFDDAERQTIEGLFSAAARTLPTTAAALGWSTRAGWLEGDPGPDETARARLTIETCAPEAAACPEVTVQTAPDSAFLPFEGDTFELAGATPAPSTNDARNARTRAAGHETGTLTLDVALTRLEPGAAHLRGLVPIVDAEGRTLHVEVDLPIDAEITAAAGGGPLATGSAAAPAARTFAAGQWFQIMLLALLGGLILNGMPCVLPVLAIKVVAVADMAEKDPREVRLHGLAYTFGVLGSMALLAGIVVAMRAAGHSVGWGFQFQEPIFVAAISAVLVSFALNLFGVYEIEFGQGRLARLGQDASGLQRSVFEGLLAVVLATPCTAPFLGTAVGFAFATSGYGIVTIFLAIGLGLASPFLAVSFSPGLARFIPRSGPWMMKLRAGLGFSLLATVVWLLWVLGQSGGSNAVVAMTAALLFLSFLLWGFGQLQPLRSVWLGRLAAVTILCLALTSFNLIDFDPVPRDTAEAAGATAPGESAEHGWQVYSEAAVQRALAAGEPAFVVFTADWCITCQVNERTVLDREGIREAFEAGGYALFKADWTRRDERIRQKLSEFGRAGVPLYLVYSPDEPDRPQVLSELLSQREVLAALELPSRTAQR